MKNTFLPKLLMAIVLLGSQPVAYQAQSYSISTYAGGSSGDGNPAVNVALAYPVGVALDAAGNLYVADPSNNRVRKVDLSGTITTLAGNGTQGYSGDGGPANAAALNTPVGLAVDAAGNVYIADQVDNRIRKVSAAGIITTFAGNGSAGFSGDGGNAAAAMLNGPVALATDMAGNVYIAEYGNNRVRKINPTGIISTLAGTGQVGFSGDGGPASAATFINPSGLAADAAGAIYVADKNNNRIRKISPSGIISTIAGNGNTNSTGDGGPGIAAALSGPTGIAVDASGNLYIADEDNNRIRKLDAGGTITAFAGTGIGTYSGDGGSALVAGLNAPAAVGTDASGNVFIADKLNNRIREVNTSGVISTVAGNGSQHYSGDGGQATQAELYFPSGAAMDASGNLFIADQSNNRVRVTAATGIISTVAGNGTAGYSGDGGNATSASLWDVLSVALDAAGNVYISDFTNNRIRKVTPAGIITTFAGNGSAGFSGDGGPATAAALNAPGSLTTDGAGNVYVADKYNHRIRKINSSGVITTFAGNGTAGYAGDGGAATSASINIPGGLAVDGSGNVYISDQADHRIRLVNSQGVISTFAGIGVAGFSGDGSAASAAQFHNPAGIAVDVAGNVFVADQSNNRIRKIASNGIVTTIAGNGTPGFAGDGGMALSSEMNAPNGVALDASGNLYVADINNNRIRKLCLLPAAPGTIVGNQTVCKGTSQTYSIPAVTGAISYSWQLPSGWSGTSAGPSITAVAGPSGGTITVVANGDCGSGAPQTLTVNVNPLPVVTANASALRICQGGSEVLTGGGADTYSWTSGVTNGVAFVPASTTTYTVTGTSTVTGCHNIAAKLITVNPLPIVTATATPDQVCQGSPEILTGGGAATYSWTNGVTNGVAFIPAGTATYTVTGTDTSGCVNTAQKTVTVNPVPSATISPSGPTTFYHLDSVVLQANSGAGYTYLWSTGATTASITVFASGTYSVVVTNPSNCSTTSSAVTIKVLPRPYKIAPLVSTCVPSTFCLPIVAVDTVKDVIGYDMTLQYNQHKVIPSGQVALSNELINTGYVDVSTRVDTVHGTINISAFLNASAPAGATFKGTGSLFCVDFTKTANFSPVDSSAFTLLPLQESYISGVSNKLVEPGKYITYKDSLFNGSLKFWINASPLGYNQAVSTQYLITNIYGTGSGCGAHTSPALQPDLSGNFTYVIHEGLNLDIERDILPTTSVLAFVNGMDALLTRKVLIEDPSFVPSIYQLVAMDVNMDGVISAGDVSQINQRAILSIPEFKQAWNYSAGGVSDGQLSKDWLFLDNTFLTSPAASISKTYPADDGIGFSKARVPVVPFCVSVPVDDVATCPVINSESYLGVMLGDVDGNFDANSAIGLMRDNGQHKIVFDLSKATNTSGVTSVPVYVGSSEEVYAVDLAWAYPGAASSIDVVSEGSVPMELYSYLNPDDHTFRLTSNSFNAYPTGRTVFSLRFDSQHAPPTAASLGAASGYINGNPARVQVIDAGNTGITENELANEVTAYPNPANQSMYVNSTQQALMQLYDISGQQLLIQSHIQANERLELDTKSLESGIYLLRIVSDRDVVVKKVVIQH